MLFDCHAHLTALEILPRLDEHLANASRFGGVRDIVAVAEGLEDVSVMLEELPVELHGMRIHKSLGLHPERASMEALPLMLDAIRQHRLAIACVGEVGLDFSPHVLGTDSEERKRVQRECLAAQVALAEGEGPGFKNCLALVTHMPITLCT